MLDEKRKCNNCKILKSLDAFNKAGFYRDQQRYRATCISCRNNKRRDSYLSNPDPQRVAAKEWRAAQTKDNLYKLNKKSSLKTRYGITLDDFNNLMDYQEGRCAICDNFAVGNGSKNKVLTVDHCHETGEIRGLLCSKCNMGLGSFNDDPYLLDKAIRYLASCAKEKNKV